MSRDQHEQNFIHIYNYMYAQIYDIQLSLLQTILYWEFDSDKEIAAIMD